MADSNYARLSCVVCVAPLSGRKKTFCSPRCKYEHGNRAAGKRPRAEYVASVKNSGHSFTCEHCGAESHRRISGTNKAKGSTNRWCSMACRVASAERRLLESGVMSAYYTSYCIDCGIALGSAHRQLECCHSCTAKRRTEAAHRARARVVTCECCATQFCPLFKTAFRGVCQPCAEENAKRLKRTGRLARKARERAAMVEAVDPIKVFQRAGWRCYLCGCDTPPQLRGSYEPNAPELEHIRPLSKGGEHSYANTACACRACNIRKAASTVDVVLPSWRGGSKQVLGGYPGDLARSHGRTFFSSVDSVGLVRRNQTVSPR